MKQNFDVRAFALSALLFLQCFELVEVAHASSAPDISLSVGGVEQLVMSADNRRCPSFDEKGRQLDVPDAPVRPIVVNGQMKVFAAHFNNIPYVSDKNLAVFDRNSCQSWLNSKMDKDPSKFSDREWLVSLYAENQRLYGLVHNEYWGGLYDNRCKNRLGKKDPWASVCLYVNLTSVQINSSDGKNRDQGTVAAFPYRFASDMNRAGVRDPSNILRSPTDGYYYFAAIVDGYKDQKAGTCVFRTKSLENADWKGWDGRSFSAKMNSPYESAPALCEPVMNLNVTTLAYSETSKEFIALIFDERVKPGGAFYATSSDLVHWSSPRLLLEVHDFSHWNGNGVLGLYPSLVDPAVGAPNFDRIGERPYLYLIRPRTKVGGYRSRDRDIVRYPLLLTRDR